MQAYWLVVRVLLTPPAEAEASQKWKIIYLQVLRTFVEESEILEFSNLILAIAFVFDYSIILLLSVFFSLYTAKGGAEISIDNSVLAFSEAENI